MRPESGYERFPCWWIARCKNLHKSWKSTDTKFSVRCVWDLFFCLGFFLRNSIQFQIPDSFATPYATSVSPTTAVIAHTPTNASAHTSVRFRPRRGIVGRRLATDCSPSPPLQPVARSRYRQHTRTEAHNATKHGSCIKDTEGPRVASSSGQCRTGSQTRVTGTRVGLSSQKRTAIFS